MNVSSIIDTGCKVHPSLYENKEILVTYFIGTENQFSRKAALGYGYRDQVSNKIATTPNDESLAW